MTTPRALQTRARSLGSRLVTGSALALVGLVVSAGAAAPAPAADGPVELFRYSGEIAGGSAVDSSGNDNAGLIGSVADGEVTSDASAPSPPADQAAAPELQLTFPPELCEDVEGCAGDDHSAGGGHDR